MHDPNLLPVMVWTNADLSSIELSATNFNQNKNKGQRIVLRTHFCKIWCLQNNGRFVQASTFWDIYAREYVILYENTGSCISAIIQTENQLSTLHTSQDLLIVISISSPQISIHDIYIFVLSKWWRYGILSSSHFHAIWFHTAGNTVLLVILTAIF